MGEKRDIGEICTRITVFADRQMSVAEAARLMFEQHVGSLVVVAEDGAGREIVGIVTDRDIAIGVAARGLDARATRVGDIMSGDVVSCRSADSMADTLDLMRRHGVRRIPVADEQDILVGIVTLDDLLEIVAEDLQTFVKVIEMARRREASGAPHG